MAAPLKANREIADRVRKLVLKEVEEVLLDVEFQKHTKEYRESIILRIIPTVLPRLTEISGEDGETLQVIVKHANEGNTIIRPTGQGDI